jgi:hypothetical protein
MTAKKDVLTTLAQARPSALDPDRLAGTSRRHTDLESILAGHDAARTVRRRRTWRLALPVAGIAAAAAVAIAVANTGTPPVAPGHVPPVQSARVALLGLADSAAQQRGPIGDYWQVDSISGGLQIKGTAPGQYVVNYQNKIRSAIATHSGEQTLMSMEAFGTAAPWQAQDRSRWQAAGAPDLSRAKPGEPLVIDNRIPFDGAISHLGGMHEYTYRELQNLPTDTAGLQAVLDQDYDSAIAFAQKQQPGVKGDEPEWLWFAVQELVDLPVPSGVRAAAYRILADLPGLVSLGQVTDPLGRTGLGFAIPNSDDIGHGTRNEWIIDPKTDAPLANGWALIKPNAQQAGVGMRPGTLVTYTAITGLRWVGNAVPLG